MISRLQICTYEYATYYEYIGTVPSFLVGDENAEPKIMDNPQGATQVDDFR